MPRRSGVTLLEVLVAIFVMGIGLLAILTLFPLGALRMFQAIQDDRCAQAGANAWALAQMKNVANEPGVFTLGDPFLNPFLPAPAASNALPNTSSYPVFIDPIGFRRAFGTPSGLNVGGIDKPGNGLGIARRTVSFVGSNQDAYQWFTSLDGIDFEPLATGGNSDPATPRLVLPPPPKQFVRDIRYSWAFMCRRPRYSDSSVVDVDIVVFSQRPLAMTAGLTLPETVYSKDLPPKGTTDVSFNTAANVVNITYGANPPPAVRIGDWILDATPTDNLPAPFGGFPGSHAYFYRIVGATDNGGNMDLEVETPIRDFPPMATTAGGTVVIIDGIANVYAKGTVRVP